MLPDGKLNVTHRGAFLGEPYDFQAPPRKMAVNRNDTISSARTIPERVVAGADQASQAFRCSAGTPWHLSTMCLGLIPQPLITDGILSSRIDCPAGPCMEV